MEKELNLGNQISKYYQSFSGTDTLAFIMMPGSSPVLIGSLTTISYSMYRNKKPVINIGRTNINGVTRGSRIFAGTMIFTLINQHWLRELQEQLTWLKSFNELKVDELPLFDIMIVSANEYGNAVAMYIYGIDFTDEAQTISVEDLFTENVFSFVARDVSNFKALNYKKPEGVIKSNNTNANNSLFQRFYILDSSSTNLDDLAQLEKELTISKIVESNKEKRHYVLARDLYFSSSRTMIGNDVANIQSLLNQTKITSIPVNGVFDSATDEAVRKYQSYIGEDIDGVVTDKLYNLLITQTNSDEVRYGTIVNKYGAYVYRQPNLQSDIVDVKPYRDQIFIHEIIADSDEKFKNWYKTSTGFVLAEDVYSAYYAGSVVEFPQIEYGDNNAYVTMIQTALSKIYPEFTEITGVYDYNTQTYIKKLQEENGLVVTGVVDNDTWLLLQSLSDNIYSEVSNDNFKIEFNLLPDVYNITSDKILEELSLFNMVISCNNYITVKTSVVCIYDDNNSETLTKTISIKDPTKISLEDFRNAFVYNPKYGKIPRQVDYIVYPCNKKSYKWTIMYS